MLDDNFCYVSQVLKETKPALASQAVDFRGEEGNTTPLKRLCRRLSLPTSDHDCIVVIA